MAPEPRAAFIVAVLGLATVSLDLNAQTGADGDGSVEGRITCNDGSTPARNATVSLFPGPPDANQPKSTRQQSFNSTTDFDGNYLFRSVPPGKYGIQVHLAGYSGDYGLLAFELTQLRLRPDLQRALVEAWPEVLVKSGSAARKDIVIRRGAAITGRVLVDTGGALIHQRVAAILVDSDLMLKSESQRDSATAWTVREETDDRGVYRIAGLPRGKYRIEVSASTLSNAGDGWIDVFAPDVLNEGDATLVSVDYGDEISDVNVTVPTGRLHSIGGVITQGGVPLSNVQLVLSREGQRGSRNARQNSDGTFHIELLPPGTYTLEAATDSQAHRPRVERKITVPVSDSDVLDVNIDLPLSAGNAPSQ